MSIDLCTLFLSELTVGSKRDRGSLRHLAFVAGEHESRAANGATKAQIISILRGYYSTPDRFSLIWSSLSAAERKIAALHIWGEGIESAACADEVAQEFNINGDRERRYFYYSDNGLDRYKAVYAEPDSRLWLLFPTPDDRCIFFEKEIRAAVGEMERVYSEVSKPLAYVTREARTADFAAIVRFCNSNKVSVTKAGIPSKSSALKLRDFCGYTEYSAEINIRPENMRTADGLLVTFPLFIFCTLGGLLATVEGKCIPGGKALSLLELPSAQLIKRLFEAYLKSRSFDETTFMRGLKAKRGHDPSAARQHIVMELKHCPPGQYMYTAELEKHLRIAGITFARKHRDDIVESGNSYYEYDVAWESYERPLLHLILSFFAALGIIDIAWEEDRDIDIAGMKRGSVAFRINPLGAYLLGMSSSYTPPAAEEVRVKGGFTVLPDYTVVVVSGAHRIKHELYFDRLFSKISETEEASIYRLDFATAVRALDNGIDLAELGRYLSLSDKPLPDNVAHALDDWKKQAGRIRLRQVTILECDDPMLLEEVVRYKGMGDFLREKVSAAVIVDSSSTEKIKKTIEKNKRFCRHVI